MTAPKVNKEPEQTGIQTGGANPAPAPEQKEPLADVPAALQSKEEKQIKTTVRNLSDIIKEKLAAMKDMATLELLLDVESRMRNRLKTIKEMGSASSINVRGHWKTTPPQMHISNLQGRKITNDTVQISFGAYEVDDKNRKVEFKNHSEVEVVGSDGKTHLVKKHLSSEYRISHEITETISQGKPIVRESIKLDRIQE